MIQMMALADAADKENRIASPASALTPLATPKPTSKPHTTRVPTSGGSGALPI